VASTTRLYSTRRLVYQSLADQDRGWERINCMAGDALRSVEQIAADLHSLVDGRIASGGE
jgi:hypothetical protein